MSFGNKRLEIIGWIEECKNLDSLQRIRGKLYKRIKSLQKKPSYNPLSNIDEKKKRKILSKLLIKEKWKKNLKV